MAASKIRPVHVVLGVIGVAAIAAVWWLALSGTTTPLPSDGEPLTEPEPGLPQNRAIDLERARRAVGGDGLLALHLNYYRQQVGRFPANLDEIVGGTDKPAASSQWRGPYLSNPALLLDPWGRPFQYQAPGEHNSTAYDLWSAGADGISGTPDDVGNWQELSSED